MMRQPLKLIKTKKKKIIKKKLKKKKAKKNKKKRGRISRAFLSGLGTLLPTILTILILVIAYNFINEKIEDVLVAMKHKAARPSYVGRAEAASPATGLMKHHNAEQAKLVDEALTVGKKK